MSTNSGLDIVDDYVDALLSDAIASPVAAVRTDSAEGSPDEPARLEVSTTRRTEAQPLAMTTSRPQPATSMHAHPAETPHTSSIPLQASHRWLRVTIGTDSYALELLCVQEVVRLAPIVAMRGANRAVLGVMNLRGRIVPVFDLGLWLGSACVQPDERSRIVVIERNDELIGVLVTLVEDVVTLSQNRIEPPLPGSAPCPIVGVARVGATPTVLLEAAALFAAGTGN